MRRPTAQRIEDGWAAIVLLAVGVGGAAGAWHAGKAIQDSGWSATFVMSNKAGNEVAVPMALLEAGALLVVLTVLLNLRLLFRRAP